jgi:hypothetical protein
VPAGASLLAGPLDRLGQPARLDGLEQIVDGANLESLHRMLGVGGAEDHDGLGLGQKLHGLHARELGHVDVEQDHVDAAPTHAFEHLVAGGALAADLDVGKSTQQAQQAPASHLFVVGDQDAQALAHADSFAVGRAKGSSISATVLRSSSAAMLKRALWP